MAPLAFVAVGRGGRLSTPVNCKIGVAVFECPDMF